MLSVQFAARVAQKIHPAKISERLAKSWTRLYLVLANGCSNIKIMHKAPKYFRSSFVYLATSFGGVPNSALNATDVLDVSSKNRRKCIGHVGSVHVSTIALA